MTKLPAISVLITDSFNQYKKQFPALWKIILVYFILINLPAPIISFLGKDTELVNTLQKIDIVIQPILMSLLSVAFIKQVASTKQLHTPDLIRSSLKKTPQYLLLMIVSGAAMIGGLLLFIIPGILIFLLLSFAQFVFVIENTTVRDSLRKSILYVKGVKLQVLIRLAAGLIPSLLIVLLQVFIPETSTHPVYRLGIGIFDSLYVPFGFIYAYYIYKQLITKDIKHEKVSGWFKVLFWGTGILGTAVLLAGLIGVFST